MRIGVLGTGTVGITLATKLAQLGNEVKMGSRSPDNKTASDWARANTGHKASHGTFEEAAKFGEMLVLAVHGAAALEVVSAAKPENFRGKIVIDTCNPLELGSSGVKLFVSNTESLSERIQASAPDAKVVKTLNTVNALLMTDPKRLGEELTVFIAGNDESAKKRVAELLKKFGWNDIIDLGGLEASRYMEMLLPMLMQLHAVWQHPNFGFKIVRKG
jgi:NADPH-dependent F420 reductase